MTHFARTAAVAAVLACSVLVAAFVSPASAGVFPIAGQVPDTNAPAASASHFSPDPTHDLSYGGGQVMTANRTHIIFWLPGNHPGLSFTAGYQSLIQRFLTDVAADSGKATNPYAITGMYTDATNIPAAYSSTFADVQTDTNPTPANGCALPATAPASWLAPGGICLTNAQLRAELDSYITANALPRGINELYFLVTPDTFGTCFGGGPTDCSLGGSAPGSYCAFHSALSDGTPYANQPFDDNPGHCYANSLPRPNGNPADITLNALSHEHNEAITDPIPNTGWYNSTVPGENGDLCANKFGAPLDGSTGTGRWNADINGHHYEIQQEWNNEISDCASAEEAPVPRIDASVTPGPPGTTISFTGSATDADACIDPAVTPCGSILSWAWDFGNGTTSGAQNPPPVTFSAAGVHPVRLTVTDTSNNTASTTQPVTIAFPAPPPTPSAATPSPPTVPPTIALIGFAATGTQLTLTLACRGVAGQRCSGGVALTTIERLRGRRPLGVTARKKHAKLKARLLTDASASYGVPAGQSGQLSLTLSSSARGLLQRFRHLPATIALDGRPANTVTFSAARKRKKRRH